MSTEKASSTVITCEELSKAMYHIGEAKRCLDLHCIKKSVPDCMPDLLIITKAVTNLAEGINAHLSDTYLSSQNEVKP